MRDYASKEAFVEEIKKTACLYNKEFADITDADQDLRLEDGERTPYENLSYQLGWLSLIRQWEREEQEGRKVQMPAPGVKWNQLGPLHQQFYAAYTGKPLAGLRTLFQQAVEELCAWLNTLDDESLFQPGGRKWASSTSANWPVWKWIHINSVAPFQSFRAKIRKWKKLRAAHS